MSEEQIRLRIILEQTSKLKLYSINNKRLELYKEIERILENIYYSIDK